MVHKLAEETLAQILAYSLDVPYQDFADITPFGNSPFVNLQTSSATVLGVCKLWMRIGTPLLYGTVVLRSTAQAERLVAALKANPPFGQYIKKLRVEGGFGRSAKRIIEFSTELSDICVSLTYTSNEKVKPMCTALEKLSMVQRLILYRPFGPGGPGSSTNNATIRLATQTVANCIQSWSSLRVVHLRSTVACSDPIRGALLSATQLEEICFPEAEPMSALDDFVHRT
ncbi:hypothetical protein AURDEDRAFT_168653 [Auricularia subglabra TFB-10046 SS5]|nr:hypothetical protein AURDEDRAFT_168653 [Auricularia subglabra TFB-10046 SS5]